MKQETIERIGKFTDDRDRDQFHSPSNVAKSIVIEAASINDYVAIQKICENDLGYACNPELVKTRLSKLDKERECVFVAIQDNTVVGFIHVEKYELLYHPAMANVLGLAVSEEYRKQGLGRALLTAAEEWAKGKNISEMRLNSGAKRKEAHCFYRNSGYTDEKEQIRFIKKF